MKLNEKFSYKSVNAILIFAVVLVFLVTLGTCYYTLRLIDTDEYWEIHSYQVSNNLDNLISDFENMETGQRGYVITGQENFLEPYTAGLSDLSIRFQMLQTLTLDNSVQQQNLSTIKSFGDVKTLDLNNSILLRKNGGFNVAQADVLTDKGKQDMDSIRAAVVKMQTEESRLLKIRTDNLSYINHATELIVIWGGIIGFLFYLLVNYIINKFVIGEIVTKPLLEKEQKALFYARSLIEASLDPLFAINPDGKITDVNEATVKVTGVSRQKIIGTDFLNYFTNSDEARRGYETVFREGFVIDYILTIKSQDGKLTDVLFNASLYKDNKGDVIGVFAAARDNTRIKKATDLIELTNKELRSLDLAKDEFVSIASHQLRTPLTALKGYTGMLLDGDAGPISEKQAEYLGEIKNANDRMIKLITSLLNVSRVDLGVFTVDPEPVNFEEAAKSVLKELETNIKEKNIKFDTSFEKDIPLLSADPKIVRMVFQNLLSNAVKYTPHEGHINLDIKKSGTDLLISVSDSGCGVPENVKSKIFTKLFRADNARVTDPSGTGLGLYIIKATIEQTGGKIWFDSKENQGSTFYVSIPLEGMKKKEGSRRLE